MRALSTLVTGALLLGASVAMANEGGRGEFGEQCAYGLSQGQKVMTDCSINFVNDRGTKLCFSSQKNAVKFMSNYDQNMAAASKNYGRE
ncbi:MAG: hypothetical protein ABI785_13340 [Gemmatimonadales bacterium]